MQSISFSAPITSIEEGKWLLGVTSFEATNFVFNITDENKFFIFYTQPLDLKIW